MFILLTLENFPTYMNAGIEVHPWSWIYFVNFVMVAAFIVLNVLIGIVLNSMEARELEQRREARRRRGVRFGAPVAERIAILRAALSGTRGRARGCPLALNPAEDPVDRRPASSLA